MKKKIVWISPHLPYDNVKHAGGQIHNYYINKLIDSDRFDVRLISFYWPYEIDDFTLNRRIPCDLFCYYDKGIKKFLRNAMDANRLLNPLDKYGNQKTLYNEVCIIKALKKYMKEGFVPDVIILQWTRVVLSIEKIKKIFPSSKIVSIEEDVLLLSLKRKIELCKGFSAKIAELRFRNLEREEIKALLKSDLVITNNHKDENILKQYGVSENVRVWAPFFHLCSNGKNQYSNVILFYGNMSRPENYMAVQWIIDKVLPLLEGEDYVFKIIGANPPDFISNCSNDKVQVLGYVSDIESVFKNSLCMIAPLLLGAGIKIKVLEIMSASVPVLTNEIGIEGIPAVDGQDFIACKTPEEYAEGIKRLLNRSIDPKLMGDSAKKMILKNFDYTKSAGEFVEWISSLG